MVSIDQSLFIQIVNFIFLIWILNVVLYKPIRNILIQRKEKVTGLEENIETFQKEAKEKDKAFMTGLKDARTKGLEKKNELIQAAEAQEKEIIAKINERAVAEMSKMRETVAKDAENVKNALMREVDAFANDIGKKILGRAI